MSNSQQAAEEHYNRGYSCFESGEYEPALKELTLCLEINPLKRKYGRFYSKIAAELLALHYHHLAQTYILQGRFAEVIKNYHRLLQLGIYPRKFKRQINYCKKFQQSVMSIYKEACELLAQEKLTKAKRKALEVLEHTPHWLVPQKLLRRIEQRDEAQDLYAQGFTLYKNGKHEEARRLLKQSLALDKDYSAPQVLLDRIKEKLPRRDYNQRHEQILHLEESVLLLEDEAEVHRKNNENSVAKPKKIKSS